MSATTATPSLASILGPGRSSAFSGTSLLARGTQGIWNHVKAHPVSTAVDVGLLAATFVVPGGFMLGAARFGIPLLGRGIAAVIGSRAVTRIGARLGGRALSRATRAILQNAPGLVGNLIGGVAKGAAAIAKGVTAAAASLAGIFQHGGGMSNVMSGQSAPSSQASSPQSPSLGTDEPLPGQLQQEAFSSAAAPRSTPAPTTRAVGPAPTGPSIEPA